MIFSLEPRRARKGDCLLLHFGSKDDPGLVMIDGGPKKVYQPHLRPRLEELKAARGLSDEDPLPVDLLMVSHVDDDHIQGILELTRELIEAQREHKPSPLQIMSFWHNSFDDIIGHKPKELTAAFRSQFGTAATSGEFPTDATLDVDDAAGELSEEIVVDNLKVLASIEQGYQLRVDAEALDLPRNPEFDGNLIIASANSESVDMGRGLTFRVAGPMKREVEALRKKHDQWLRDLEAKGKSPPQALAAYLDKSVPNLSSLVLVAEVEGQRMLLTGDARGDMIIQGLQLVSLLGASDQSTMHVDLLKVPHHGSANNLEREFFERITADHYVFSGNGEHGNPERQALEMLLDAREDTNFSVHFTYPVKEIDEGRAEDWKKEQTKEENKRKKGSAVTVRSDWSPKKHSLEALLAERRFPKERLSIVDAESPHIIDLLDPVGS
jgi:hypothetical protein